MVDGRPEDDKFSTYFSHETLKINIDSLDFKTDVSGKQFFSGMLRDGLKHGFGREWLLRCRLFIG
jgi:hypothetical protein